MLHSFYFHLILIGHTAIVSTRLIDETELRNEGSEAQWLGEIYEQQKIIIRSSEMMNVK